ncbi:MAG: hypothetical protein ACREBE_14595, partial [bacterium]
IHVLFTPERPGNIRIEQNQVRSFRDSLLIFPSNSAAEFVLGTQRGDGAPTRTNSSLRAFKVSSS